MDTKITVIVPVYNAEGFIDKCINSILSQKFDNWNLILIDDGSTDNSLNICTQYAAQDKRIKVVHQNNMGAGIARNSGIDIATGEYIVFIDSDDYISSDYFSLLSSHDEDIVYIDIEARTQNQKVVRKEYMSKYTNLTKEDFIRYQMTGAINWGGVRKAVKLQLLQNYSIRYSATKVGEEAILSFKELHFAQSIGFINNPVYFYIQHEDSLSHTRYDNAWGEVAIEMRKCLKQLNIYPQYASTCNAFIYTAAAGSAYSMSCNYPWRTYKNKANDRLDLLKDELDDEFPIDYKYVSFNSKVIGFLFTRRFYKLVWLISNIRKIIL